MAEVRLNVGCGDRPLSGFVNLDLGRDADIALDVRRGLPCADNTVDIVHSEHFVEHLSQAELVSFLRECRRVLAPGGVVRVSTPDLAEMVRCYLDPDWHDRSGLKDYGYDWLDNPCEMFNVGMRDWGHKWVVDERELTRLADLAGLASLGRRAAGESDLPALRGLETRAGDHLVMEFRKPPPSSAGPLPLVSVLIPAYNPRFFAEALDSACGQTWPHLEILVGDDSDGGEIETIARARQADDPRIVYHRNAENLGEALNYRELLARSRGVYVKPLADDDLLEPACVEVLVGVLERHPDVSLAAAYRKLVDEGGGVLPDTFNKPLADMDVRLAGPDAATLLLARRRNYIGEPTCALFRRRDLTGVRPEPMSFAGRRAPMNGDVAMWLTLLSKGDLALLAAPLSRFRQHEGQSGRVEAFVARADTAWDYVREDARRVGLGKSFLPPGGLVDARPLDAVAHADAPEVSLLVRGARDLPELLVAHGALAGEGLAYPHEYVYAGTGPDPAAGLYLARTAAHDADKVLPPDGGASPLAAAVAAARGAYLVLLEPRDLPAPGWLEPALQNLASRNDLAAISLAPAGPLLLRSVAWELGGLEEGLFDRPDWADAACARLATAGLEVERVHAPPDLAADAS